eukprot:15266013-Ditylum_brightwellii.AAC.1
MNSIPVFWEPFKKKCVPGPSLVHYVGHFKIVMAEKVSERYLGELRCAKYTCKLDRYDEVFDTIIADAVTQTRRSNDDNNEDDTSNVENETQPCFSNE